jgi:hypothetical protein
MPDLRPSLDSLKNAPRELVAPAARGLAVGDGSAAPVDRTGGDFGAGLIRGVALVTRGEADGHYFWMDSVFLRQVADALNADPKGVTVAFGHPDHRGGTLDSGLGRAKNAVIDGDVVRGDLHFTKSSHNGPRGDLSAFVMDRAEEDPEGFGMSIRFDHDYANEELFYLENGGWGAFVSPDPDNALNLPHARLARLRGADAVDQPAGNPDGLFSVPADAEAFFAYMLGVSDTRPASAALGIDPDRARSLAARYLSDRGLKVAQVGAGDMSQPGTELNTETQTPPAAAGQPEASPPPPSPEAAPTGEEATAAQATAGDGEGAEKKPDPKEAALSEARSDLSRFIALDPVEGPKWWTEGKPYAEAAALAVRTQRERNEALASQLAAAKAALGGPPVDAGHEGGADGKQPASNLSTGLARFASSITLPGRN